MVALTIYGGYRKDAEAERAAADRAIIDEGLRKAMSAEEYAAYKAQVAADQAADARRQVLEREKESATYNAKNDVRALLRDADSAKFGHQQTYSNPDSLLGLAICGYVNAKNGFGGYTGEKGYIVVDRRARIDDGSESFSAAWNRLCR